MDLNDNSQQNSDLLNNLEALLYFFNEPTSFKKLAKLLNIEPDKVLELSNELAETYSNRGLQIIVSTSDVQLVAVIVDEEILDQLDTAKLDTKMTPAVVETLAVVLYRDGADETTIDNIRGVRSSRTLRKLVRRGYLTLNNQKQYHVTAEALRQLGITSREDLPQADTLSLQLETLASTDDK